MDKKHKQLLNLAMLAGTTLMENGAESYRVEDTVERILSIDENINYEVLALITGLIVGFRPKEGEAVTSIRRIKERKINLSVIDAVNTVSRQLVAGQIDIDTAYEKLKVIAESENENRVAYYCHILMGFGFTLMAGGNLLEALVGAIAACTLRFSSYILRDRVSGSFMPSFIHAFTVSLCLVFFVHLIPVLRMDRMAIGSLIHLFPGTVLTNGIRDTMKGDYLTAAGNLLSALSSALALASGTATVLFITGGSF